MKKFNYPLVLLILSLFSCNSLYKKADSGYEYRIISQGNGKKAVYGNFIQFHLRQMYRDAEMDTLLGDTRDYISRIEQIDTSNFPATFIKAFTDARKGDSIVIRISTDSSYNYPYAQIPAYMHRGGYTYITFNILNIFDNIDEVDSARKSEIKIRGLDLYNRQLVDFERSIIKDSAQIATDSKVISAYLDKNKLLYKKGKWGTFIVVHDEGTGNKIEYNSVIAVNYTGKTLDSGKVFDTNIGNKFGHEGSYEVSMRQLGSVIPGWTDGLMQLNDGAKATLYIPSSLAYGKTGKPGRISPDANIIYELKIVKVITEDEAMRIVTENRKRAESANKQ